MSEPQPGREVELVAYKGRAVRLKRYTGGWDIEVRVGGAGKRADATAVFKDLDQVHRFAQELLALRQEGLEEQRRRTALTESATRRGRLAHSAATGTAGKDA